MNRENERKNFTIEIIEWVKCMINDTKLFFLYVLFFFMYFSFVTFSCYTVIEIWISSIGWVVRVTILIGLFISWLRCSVTWKYNIFKWVHRIKLKYQGIIFIKASDIMPTSINQTRTIYSHENNGLQKIIRWIYGCHYVYKKLS